MWPGNDGTPLALRCAAYDRLFNGSRYVFEEGQEVSGIPIERLLDFLAFLKNFVDGLMPTEWIEWHEPQSPATS